MYKKICKYKKIILLCLVFTLSFNLISVKQEKEVQATVLIDDLLFWTLGLLVLSTGVVAVNNDQVFDMGYSVAKELENSNMEYLEQVKTSLQEDLNDGDVPLLQVTEALKTAINTVADTLTTTNVYKPVGEGFMTTTIPVNSFPKSKGIFNDAVDNYIDIGGNLLGSYIFSGNVNVYYNDKLIMEFKDLNNRFYALVSFQETVVSSEYSIGYINELTSGDNAGMYKMSGSKYLTGLTRPGTLTITSDKMINSVLTIPYSNPVIKEGYNPTYTNENLKTNNYIPIPLDIPTDTVISTDIPLTWDKAIEQGLVTDIPQDKARQLTGDFTGDLTGEVTGSLDTGLDISFPNIFEMLKELLIYLFYPTVSVSDLFSIPAGSGFAGLVDLFNWDSLFNIEPKPYEFVTDMEMNTLIDENDSKTWHIELKLFDTQFMKNNIGIVRNVLSYSLLISVIYFVVYHFIPRRDMD